MGGGWGKPFLSIQGVHFFSDYQVNDYECISNTNGIIREHLDLSRKKRKKPTTVCF